MKNNIIYQLALRSFTPEGTLSAAAKLLGHVAALGADIVYVCPFFKEDDDSEMSAWSERQLASHTDNPKNPYKIADYFAVDNEFGTEADLLEFTKTAHKNGLKVMFDLVYLHCGRNAVFIKDNPEFVVRNSDGSVTVADRWPFARLNFESRGLREYLIKNMETLMCDYGADCFRCDVGDSVPLDFWGEAFGRLKKINHELITLNEGIKSEYIKDVFDMCYDFDWNTLLVGIFSEREPAEKIRSLYEKEKEIYGAGTGKLIRTIETHDTASDCGLKRNEIIMTPRGVEAALVVTNTFEGVPFLWNGYEFCDNAENNMFSNRFHGRRSVINWSRAFTADGKRRLEFIKNIHHLRHESAALCEGDTQWIENSEPQKLISYSRNTEGERIIIIVNTRNEAVEASIGAELADLQILMESGVKIGDRISAEPYGYVIAKL